MIKTKKTYHSNGQLNLEYETFNGLPQGLWKEYYENGQLAEEGEYVEGKYYVKNFWSESGEHLLVNGTGKTIRRFGVSQSEVYEQYFEKGKFIREKKIYSVSYGKFKPNK